MGVSLAPGDSSVATARLLMVGQSHLGAFLGVFEPTHDGPSIGGPEGLSVDFVRVAKQRAVALTPGPDGPRSTILGGWRQDVPTLATEVARLAGSMDAVALAWRGNEMNVRGLFATGPPFDLILPGDPAPVIDGAELLPYAALAGFARRTLDEDEGLEAVVTAVRAAGVERVLLLSPPPPRGDEVVLAKLSGEAFLAERARSLGFEPADVPLTPAPVRRKLWRVLVAAYGSYAADHELEFIASPPLAATADGLLADAFHADDVSHGNVRYGRLYLDAIATALRG